LIKQGAEAKLYLSDNKLIKERISKGYRIKEIDDVKRKYPTRNEAKLIKKAKEVGVNVPDIFSVDDKTMKVEMEYLKGDLVKNVLEKLKDRNKILKQIGEQINRLHENNIIHGDLTTSNMIIKDDQVYFIDFGLGFISDKLEDKAVDLRLLRQAFESKHYTIINAFENVLKGYKNKQVLERLKVVEKRGRYKRKV